MEAFEHKDHFELDTEVNEESGELFENGSDSVALLCACEKGTSSILYLLESGEWGCPREQSCRSSRQEMEA